jgi:CRP-like cAMP-binding protein
MGDINFRSNKILATLASEDLDRLSPYLEPVDLPLRKVLEIRNRRVENVVFITEGLASVVITGGSQHTVEVGIIGNEGMTGIPLLMAAELSPQEVFMQAPGNGLRIGAEQLKKAIKTSQPLWAHLLRHAHVFQVQTSFTALANARYKLEERLARWLLMADDRSSRTEMRLTHEFLALMLGVRRPGVTVALNLFEERGLITRQRGAIAITDRAGLEEASNGSYGVPEAEYERLFGIKLRANH